MDIRFGATADFYRSGLADKVMRGSEDFPGFLVSADAEAWDTARVGTHSLQYQDSTQLAANDLLTIAAATYKVVGQPKRINGSEYIADLVRQ